MNTDDFNKEIEKLNLSDETMDFIDKLIKDKKKYRKEAKRFKTKYVITRHNLQMFQRDLSELAEKEPERNKDARILFKEYFGDAEKGDIDGE